MAVLTNDNLQTLWRDSIKVAETRCSISLAHELESYLVSLLMRHTNDIEMTKQVLASNYLDAQQKQHQERQVSLQIVGDQCLLYAGLFPQAALRKQVKITYFVELGRSAYISISHTADDLFETLAYQFVALMDVLQSLKAAHELMPFEAYELWHEVGSQRAFHTLQSYSNVIPIKTTRR